MLEPFASLQIRFMDVILSDSVTNVHQDECLRVVTVTDDRSDCERGNTGPDVSRRDTQHVMLSREKNQTLGSSS